MQSVKEGGAGIGLAISRKLARQIGAEVVLDSTDVNGSCFLVSISLRDGDLEKDGLYRAEAPE